MKPHKLILIGTLVSALFFLISCTRPQAEKDSRRFAKATTRISAQQLEKEELEALLKQLRSKNPFRRDHASGMPTGIEAESGLKGIIWDVRKPYALIGDRIVMQGDYIDNKKVLKINKDSVVLDNHGKEEILRLELAPNK